MKRRLDKEAILERIRKLNIACQSSRMIYNKNAFSETPKYITTVSSEADRFVYSWNSIPEQQQINWGRKNSKLLEEF